MKKSSLIVFVIFSFSCSPKQQEENKKSADTIPLSQQRFQNDTVWSPDKSEYDLGTLVSGKRLGKWRHYYKNDSTRWEEQYYLENEIMIKCCYFKHGRLYLEKNYLSNGVYSISYYNNGCINTMGWTRTIEDHQGEGDGLWVQYDSLGNLQSEIFYDYPHDKILYKEYEPSHHFLVKECEYYQEWGEGTQYKNGIWKFYKNGKLERTEKHNMEATLDPFGE
jgi:antitoxin component YwqK of YwqJK toxin-antitoxin module